MTFYVIVCVCWCSFRCVSTVGPCSMTACVAGGPAHTARGGPALFRGLLLSHSLARKDGLQPEQAPKRLIAPTLEPCHPCNGPFCRTTQPAHADPAPPLSAERWTRAQTQTPSRFKCSETAWRRIRPGMAAGPFACQVMHWAARWVRALMLDCIEAAPNRASAKLGHRHSVCSAYFLPFIEFSRTMQVSAYCSARCPLTLLVRPLPTLPPQQRKGGGVQAAAAADDGAATAGLPSCGVRLSSPPAAACGKRRSSRGGGRGGSACRSRPSSGAGTSSRESILTACLWLRQRMPARRTVSRRSFEALFSRLCYVLLCCLLALCRPLEALLQLRCPAAGQPWQAGSLCCFTLQQKQFMGLG